MIILDELAIADVREDFNIEFGYENTESLRRSSGHIYVVGISSVRFGFWFRLRAGNEIKTRVTFWHTPRVMGMWKLFVRISVYRMTPVTIPSFWKSLDFVSKKKKNIKLYLFLIMGSRYSDFAFVP